MIGVDTNVLVRYFVRDDRYQAELADAFMKSRSAESPLFINLVVLVELAWVLDRIYSVPKGNILAMIGLLAQSPAVVIERHHLVMAALQFASDHKIDLADAVITLVAEEAGCTHVVTFDRDAAKYLAGMELLA